MRIRVRGAARPNRVVVEIPPLDDVVVHVGVRRPDDQVHIGAVMRVVPLVERLQGVGASRRRAKDMAYLVQAGVAILARLVLIPCRGPVAFAPRR